MAVPAGPQTARYAAGLKNAPPLKKRCSAFPDEKIRRRKTNNEIHHDEKTSVSVLEADVWVGWNFSLEIGGYFSSTHTSISLVPRLA